MRVLMLTLGTQGDVEPLLRLAVAMAARGHQVEVGTSPFFVDRALAGLRWLDVGPGSWPALLALTRDLGRIAAVARRDLHFVQHWTWPALQQSQAGIQAAMARADYLVTNVPLPQAPLRDGLPLPWCFVTYEPPEATADVLPPGDVNRLNLMAVSRALVDADGGRGTDRRLTGFWQGAGLPATPPATLPADLLAFLDAGPAPAVLTMGSMASFDPRALLRSFEAALKRCGLRGVVVGGWSGLGSAGQATARLWAGTRVDYAALLPRCACVVHHGGSGTVAASLRAGRGSVLLPQIGSQLRFAEVLGRAGVCTASLDTARLGVPVLADALHRAAFDPAVQRAAARWPALLQCEPGLPEAVALIEMHAEIRQAAGLDPARAPAAAFSPLPPATAHGPGRTAGGAAGAP